MANDYELRAAGRRLAFLHSGRFAVEVTGGLLSTSTATCIISLAPASPRLLGPPKAEQPRDMDGLPWDAAALADLDFAEQLLVYTEDEPDKAAADAARLQAEQLEIAQYQVPSQPGTACTSP